MRVMVYSLLWVYIIDRSTGDSSQVAFNLSSAHVRDELFEDLHQVQRPDIQRSLCAVSCLPHFTVTGLVL